MEAPAAADEQQEVTSRVDHRNIPFVEPPFDATVADEDQFAAARMRRVRDLLRASEAERRIASCVDQLLGADELPANPYPALAKLLRKHELEVDQMFGQDDGTGAQQISDARSSPTKSPAKASKARSLLWRENEVSNSQADALIGLLPRHGAAWKGVAGMVDGHAAYALFAALEGTQLLAATARAINTSQSSFTVKSCCALTGAHAFSGRVIARNARTVEIQEHVQVRGPGSHLDAAITAFAEHICSSALALHATKEHFVQELEVFTGDGDAFDEVATAEVKDARSTSNARGTPERFGLLEMHKRSTALARALQAAAMAQLPIFLHLMVCVPMPATAADTAGATAQFEPPRWEFVSVQKRFCFFYEATLPGNRTAPASRAKTTGTSSDDPPPRFQPLQLQSLFQCVWVSDADAAWYNSLRENRTETSSGGVSVGDARAAFVAFVRGQACRFLMRRDYFNLLETLLLLLPEVPRTDRESLLSEVRACYSSDAGELAALAHQSHVAERVLAAADSPATPEPKRLHAHGVLDRQCQHLADQLHAFCSRARWADVEPVKAHLLAVASAMRDEQGRLRVDANAQRNLRRLRRICHAMHQTLLSTFIAAQSNVSAMVGRIWADTEGVEVPVSLQAPSMRIRVVNVAVEQERQRKTKIYPASLAREAVLMQYVVDTQLERAIATALEDIYATRVLKGNPMNIILLRIKASSQRFELWKEADEDFRRELVNTRELTIHDLRRNIYTKQASGDEKGAIYVSSSARWGDVSGAASGARDTSAADASRSGGGVGHAIYGVRPSLVLADQRQLHELRGQLSELMPMRTTTAAQRYECTVQTTFTGPMLILGSFADLDSLHAVELREDHFVRGPAQNEAISIHCQHVIQSFIRVHQKTRHLVSALVLGGSRWTLQQVMAKQRDALTEATAAVNRGLPLHVHAFALVRGAGGRDARYVAVEKAHHLCHIPTPSASGSAPAPQSWPARTTQLFDSAFLSPMHVQFCLEAEATTVGDPLQSWRAKKWANTLAERVQRAQRDGDVISACIAVVQRGMLVSPGLEHQLDVLPVIGRLLTSTAARLRLLAQLNRTIQGVLECTISEENKLKLDNKALVRMFHAYRGPVLETLSSDDCCSFEAMRVIIQEAIFGLLTDLRMQGVLGGDAQMVLEAIEDYLHLVELSMAVQVVSNDDLLMRTLHEASTARLSGHAT